MVVGGKPTPPPLPLVKKLFHIILFMASQNSNQHLCDYMIVGLSEVHATSRATWVLTGWKIVSSLFVGDLLSSTSEIFHFFVQWT